MARVRDAACTPAENAVTLGACVRGAAFWTPGHAGFTSFVGGEAPDPALANPRAELLPARLRRRTSLLTKMVAEVATRAVVEARPEPGSTPLDLELARERLADLHYVFVSAWGEIATTDELLDEIERGTGPISPTGFTNSVHNTATGYLSLATGNHRGSTAISGGMEGLVNALMVASSTVAIDGCEVLLVIADESVPEAFGAARHPPMAAALWLAPRGAGPLGFVAHLLDGPGQGERIGVDPAASAIVPLFTTLFASGPPLELETRTGRLRVEVA